jgi:hypothetical protein
MEPPTISKKREYLVKFIQSKGFEPLSQNSEEPDVDDLWDIIDENGWVEPTFYTQGSSSRETTISCLNCRDMSHRVSFPAVQTIMNNDKTTYLYYINGQKHNLYGPAVVEISDGKMVNEEFWEYGKQVVRDRTQSISFKYVEEFLSKSGEKEYPFHEIQGYDVISQNIVGSLFPYTRPLNQSYVMKFGLSFDTKEKAQKFIDEGSVTLNQITHYNPELSDEYILGCANKKDWGVTGVYIFPKTDMLVDLNILIHDEKDLGFITMPTSSRKSGVIVKKGDQKLIDSGNSPELWRFIDKINSDVPFEEIKEFTYSLEGGHQLNIKFNDGEKDYFYEHFFASEYDFDEEYYNHYSIILDQIGKMTSLEKFEYSVEMPAIYELDFLDNVVLPKLKTIYIKYAFGKSITNFLKMNPSVDTFRTSFLGLLDYNNYNISVLPDTVLHIIFDGSSDMEKEPEIDDLLVFEEFIGPKRESVTFDVEVNCVYSEVIEEVISSE